MKNIWYTLAAALARYLLGGFAAFLVSKHIINNDLATKIVPEGSEVVAGFIITVALGVLAIRRLMLNHITTILALRSQPGTPLQVVRQVAKQMPLPDKIREVMGATRNAVTVLLLGLILLAPIAQSACGGIDQRKLINGLSACFLGLDKASDLLTAENTAGRLDDASELAIRDEMARIAERIDTLENRIEKLDTITVGNKADFLSLVDGVMSDLDHLNSSGSLGFKSDNARGTFNKFIKTSRGGVAVLRLFLGNMSQPVPAQPVKEAIKAAKGGR